MRTILYTGHDEAYRPLANITVPRMAEYAERHGVDFTCYTEPLIDVPNGIYWTGVCGAIRAFDEGYDAATYLDVDQLVTNYDAKFPPMAVGFHASKDWGEDAVEPWQFSMCGFMVFPSAHAMLTAVLGAEPDWRDKPFPEQGPMQAAIKSLTEGLTLVHNAEKYQGFINIHPRKVFNCVPDQVCPGKVPEPWAKGDWCAHLTMVPVERRIEIAKEILASL